MTFDLFAGEPSLELLSIEDADISFAQHIELPAPADSLLRELIERTSWQSESITVWGKKHLQPRLTAWYGDAGKSYSYSGIDLDPLPWTKTLLQIREMVQKLAHERFNSVLLNYYRDHRDGMGFHSDDEPDLGPTPVIASLSLGATRTFILKHKFRRELKPVRLELPSGSLLLMKGQTQTFWKHGIDKLTKPCGPRVNLTFRRIYLK
jgi:alkylated DNA repair dioxygenase AlkB